MLTQFTSKVLRGGGIRQNAWVGDEEWHMSFAETFTRYRVGIIERGVPQAYIRARASSAMLSSVHVLRVFLCIFYIKKGI